MTTLVMVTVPDGVYEGQEFVLEYDGQQLTVCCPEGCGPGSDINLEVPAKAAESSAAAAPNLVDVAVPDGCSPGMEFTVEFEGCAFNVVVPEGVNAGEMLTVEVPAADSAPLQSPARQQSPPPKSPAPKAPQDSTAQAPAPRREKMNLEIPAFRGAVGGGIGGASSEPFSKKSVLEGLDIPPYRGPLKGVTANSVNSHAKWAPATSLFDMNPDEGYGRPAGDFSIGQLIQVYRSNGSWTYGKVMDYDPTGCNYTVMTKAGPKYMVEREDITVEIVENPNSGQCAQQ